MERHGMTSFIVAALVAATIVCAVLLAGRNGDTAQGYPLRVEQSGVSQNSLLKPTREYEPLSSPNVLPEPAHTLKVPILMYHHIGEVPDESDSLRGLTVSTAAFAAQMDYLNQAGYTPISQGRLFKALMFGDPLPPNPVILTFDDGYLDNYLEALPILEDHGYPATFYILTGKVGILGYMNWQQVADLDWRGMDIGAHTVSHHDLTTIPAEEAQAEIKLSVTALYEQLGHPVYWFSYPAGKYNESTMIMAWQAGLLMSVSTLPGDIQSSDLPHGLHRYRVEADTSLEEFAQLLQ